MWTQARTQTRGRAVTLLSFDFLTLQTCTVVQSCVGHLLLTNHPNNPPDGRLLELSR